MTTFLEELKLNRLALAIGCVFAASSPAVFAQDTGADDEQENTATEEPAEKIQVLGSRIRTDGLDQASPVEIISASEAVDQGLVTLGDLLRTSTVAAGSNQITAATSTAFVTEGGTGTETLSLRGLGANRTLVLLNGRRIGPAGTRGQVSAFDLNIMPLSAVERVEILKDGASSLYGSDAVAGVVNIITKDGDESSFNLNMVQPMDDGGSQFRLSGTMGRSFDSGSVRIVGDYQKQQELARGDRDFFACANAYVFDPETGERRDVVDPRTGEYHCNDLLWGHVWIYDYSGEVPIDAKAQYDYDGNLGQYLDSFNERATGPASMRTPEGWYPVAYDRESFGLTNADHPFQDLETLSPETEVATVFVEGEYWASDTTTMYAEVLLNRRKTITNGYRQFWSYIYNENFFAGNSLSEGWTGAQWLSPTPITDHSGSEITVDYRRFVAGIEGSIGQWYWDINYQDSRSDGDYQTKIIYQDAIFDQNFLTGSCEGMELSVRGIPCQDVPWLDPQFLAGNISPEMQEFLFGSETGNTIYEQRTLEGTISGEWFEMPAGMVGVAAGLSFQEDKINDTPGEVTLAGNSWGMTSAGITRGDSFTRAAFAELQLPLARDLPLMKRLDLSMSARFTDVSTYGNDTTYKASLNWTVNDDFRIRASQGTSFRSPALYELFLNDQTSFARQGSIDPCRLWQQAEINGTISEQTAENCEADGIPPDFAGAAISAEVTTSGGLGDLEAETSTARTLGFVWTPDFTEFAMSIDYFDIEIEDEVTLLGAGTIVYGCYESQNFETEPLCDLFTRNETDLRVDNVINNYINISNQINRGIDLQMSYPFSTSFAEFELSYEHTYQIEASRKLLPTSVRQDSAGRLGRPEHVGNFNFAMMKGDWTFNWTARYIGDASNHEFYGEGEYRDDATYWGEEVRVDLATPSVVYHAFSATRDFVEEGVSVTFGLANAFDKEPPKLSSHSFATRIGNAAFYSQYDWLGRRAFVNISYEF
ncbi:TonB-dependent receptor domain-containing protein [Pseudidiomarina insulisalsae]|uniref:TonB-dependent receptor n=1 Tax=Pseudidiomarina insulisalsae TaxID=575789 RepID=A0A432YEN7_9GAMM|nr:TonB-dependent receptor [Pseudidiomarina insulisalsae]RUO59412.1 TonB-dependent receptor [Pseudidiomarina insulisalsae]